MSDIVISHARENEAAVRRLADALRREGYAVWHDDSPAPGPESSERIAERIGRARAVVVLWSEAAAASEWVRAEANVARGQGKLVQAVADGAAPPIPFDPARAAPLADWQGASDHPGWNRVREEVAALAGPPPEDARTVVALSPAPSPPEIPPQPAPAATAAPPSHLAPLLIMLALLVLVVGGGAYTWQKGLIAIPGLRSGAGSSELTSELPPGPEAPTALVESAPPPPATAQAAPDTDAIAPASEEEAFTQESVIRNERGFVLVRSAPDGGGLTLARINADESFGTYPQQGPWWRVRTANGTIGYVEAGSIRSHAQLRTEARAEAERRRPKGPRINRRNSENMRLFCAGAGAGTPQCRTFQRQLRN